jgi:hypothetical protein
MDAGELHLVQLAETLDDIRLLLRNDIQRRYQQRDNKHQNDNEEHNGPDHDNPLWAMSQNGHRPAALFHRISRVACYLNA